MQGWRGHAKHWWPEPALVWLGPHRSHGRGDEVAQTAQDTFNGRIGAVTSRQHSELGWFALRERRGKALDT